MSRLWPTTPAAQDQPYSKLILSTHVFTRAIQSGSLVGVGAGTSLYLIRYYQILPLKSLPKTFLATLLRSSAIGAIAGTGLLAVGLPARMIGKGEIGWKERSWGLLRNKGQLECDDWTYSGMAVGLIAAMMAKGRLGWIGLLGSASLGSLGGMAGYMAWRYGVNEGNFD
jgi:hypothetical protein